MKVTPFLIESFAKWLVGGQAFGVIRRAVIDIDNEELSGSAKFSHVVGYAKEFGIALSGWALNVAIELAVAWARSKTDGKT